VQGGAKEMHEDWVGPPPELKDTIYAQSTALGMGGIAVIRVSGPDALVALQRLSRPGAKVPKPRYATLRTIVEPDTQQELDSSLVLFFPGAERVRERDLNICMYIKELNIYSPRAKYIYICTHTHTHTHTHVYSQELYVYVCMYLCMYVCIIHAYYVLIKPPIPYITSSPL
jgi:hypothetical protein